MPVMSNRPDYAARVIAVIRQCVALTPASWCQWAAELSDPILAPSRWAALVHAAGIENRSDVRRDVLAAVWAEATREFEAVRLDVQAADRRLRGAVA